MAIFKKKEVVAQLPQQILIQEFPRNANSMIKRIQVLEAGEKKLELDVIDKTNDMVIFLSDTEKQMTSLHEDINNLKKSIHDTAKVIDHLMRKTSEKASSAQFDRLNKLVDKYDFGNYMTRRQFLSFIKARL